MRLAFERFELRGLRRHAIAFGLGLGFRLGLDLGLALELRALRALLLFNKCPALGLERLLLGRESLVLCALRGFYRSALCLELRSLRFQGSTLFLKASLFSLALRTQVRLDPEALSLFSLSFRAGLGLVDRVLLRLQRCFKPFDEGCQLLRDGVDLATVLERLGLQLLTSSFDRDAGRAAEGDRFAALLVADRKSVV